VGIIENQGIRQKPPGIRLPVDLNRRASVVRQNFRNCRGKLIHAGARHDDRITATVCFLGDAKKLAAIVFAKLHVEVFTLDLHLSCLDEIIHVCKKPRSLGRSASKREAVFLKKKRACYRFIENRFRNRLTLPRGLFRALAGDGEIDLTFKGVDPRDEDANFIPD